jgi:hypothetical protein
MNLTITRGEADLVWPVGPTGGVTSTTYAFDGTLVEVIALLEKALCGPGPASLFERIEVIFGYFSPTW